MSDNAAIIRRVYDAFLRGDIPAVLRDGKIVRFQQYVDTWQFAQVTGITPHGRALA